MVDNYTGAVVLHPCDSESANEIAFGLLYKWYPIHGLPLQMISDRGTGFISRANRKLCKLLGIKNLFTSAYHPQTNAKAERVVQEVKKSLRLLNIRLDDHLTEAENLDGRQVNAICNEIKLLLPSIQFNLNQKIHSMTQVSPHMLTI